MYTVKRGKKRRFPGAEWLSSHLSHKAIFALVLLGVVSFGILCLFFLAHLGSYAGKTYDLAVGAAQEAADHVADFLVGSEGQFTGLEEYLEERELCCAVRGEDGALLFARLPFDRSDLSMTAQGREKVSLPGGERLEVLVWIPAIEREELSSALVRGAMVGLLGLTTCVFFAAVVIVLTLVVAPTVRLRENMQRYYESGELPQRTGRQDELGRLQNTFVDLVGVVEQKEQAERRLIASISHDIKTPLTSVLGYSERLCSADLPEDKRQECRERVYEKALRLKAVVDEFDNYLDVGLRDTAPMQLTTAGALCHRLEEEYRAELQDAGVAFQVECQCPKAQLICNWEHMRRLFGNLIGNSIQHSGAEHLALSLQCRQEGGQIQFLFWDNGRGVPSQLLQQIFEPLYTSDRGRKVSGLGLSICKSIMKAHGGSISAENLPQGGLCVKASLPEVRL